ncbi:MAG: ABC transporter ATP-binding protein [Christensenellales bacterium]|jgi:ATP-binding cassette subfamily B multidrug efflux pump
MNIPMPGGAGRRGGYYTNEKARFDPRLFRKLMRFALPYWKMLLLALLLMGLFTAADIYRPMIEGRAIDTFIEGVSEGTLTMQDARDGLMRLVGLYALMILAQFVLSYCRTMTLRSTGQRIIRDIRMAVFRKVQRLPLSFFDKHPAGVVVTRIVNDPEALNELFTTVVLGMFQNIIVLLAVTFAIFRTDVPMALCLMAAMPLIAVATIVFRLKARVIFLEIRNRLAHINAFLDEHISGMGVIKAFHMEKAKIDEFKNVNKAYYRANMRNVVVMGIFRPFIDCVRYLALALLLWYGGIRTLGDAASIGMLYMFIKYMGMFFHPLMELAEEFNTLQSSMAAGQKIHSILEEDEEVEPSHPVPVARPVRGRIEFDHVWFAYEDDNWVLRDVSFVIEPGQSAAFVGATGAGKTSIINLLCGFYEYQKGRILIDGVEIKSMSKKEYRRHIGLVLQDVFLMAGDITTNIRMWNERISDQRVREIARYVQADSFIEKLPGGYDHVLRSGGSTLSSGERQLISFARALTQDPEILVMDEATANIDTNTELLIQEALVRLQQNRTTIAVAHRLSTIKNADRIFVIHRGRIRESGSHSELMEHRGLYYHLVQLQYNGAAESAQQA